MVVPGNPGSILFYSPFLYELFSALAGRADIICVSHHAHNLGTKDKDKVPPCAKR